jgi:hypothetical protein
MKKPLSALAVLCAAAAVHACNADAAPGDDATPGGNTEPGGTDTGNPYDDPNGEGTAGGNCTEEETELDPGATTPLGFNAQAIIDLVAGEHTESLAWLDSPTEYGPESGVSEITLNITPIGAAVFVDREVRTSSNTGEEGGPGIGLGEIYSPCNDSVRLNVSIHMTTAGGAFDETVETTIDAKAGDFASGSFSIDLTEIAGAFQATPVAPANFVIIKSSLSAQLGFTTYGSVGAFSLSSESRSTDGQAAGQGGGGPIAHFPAENYCGPAAVSVTADQIVRGLSMGQALDALNAMSPGPVRYSSGAPSDLTLAFTSSEERVCARFDDAIYGDGTPGSMTLEFPGVVRLISTDGRIDGTVPLRITASNDTGGVRTSAEGTIDAEAAAAAASLPAQFGIHDDIDFSAYDGAIVQLLTTVDEQNPGGTLRVYGLDVADCVNNPPPPDPGGMGSPGCRGTDRIPLWGAYWGEWDLSMQ